MRKKVYLILLLVSLFALAVGAASPATNAAAQIQGQTSACEDASAFLTGRLAELPRVTELIRETCEFRVLMGDLDSNISIFDRRFIESAIAGNMLEIQTLEYTLERTTDPELRGLLQMMIRMHTSDLEMALEVADMIEAEQTPDLMNARVYQQTPLYNLGIRRVNLVARFLDPLQAVGGGTPTPIPTSGTVVPTDTGTLPPPNTPTDTPTPFTTETSTPTPFITETGTSLATETGTPVGAETGTAVATDTTTPVVATNTGTAIVTTTETAIMTGSPTAAATETGTAIPTIVPPTRPDFIMLAMHVIEDEHMMSIATALAAQRLAQNSEIRAFAKHLADVAQLHLLLLDDLKYRLDHGLTLPEPQFQEDYQSPRRLVPASNEVDE